MIKGGWEGRLLAIGCSESRCVFIVAGCVQNGGVCSEWRCVFRMPGGVQNGAVCSECVFRVALCVQSMCSEWRCVQSGAVCSECVFRVALCVQSGAVCSEWRCVFRVEHWDVQNELLHGHWYEETLKDPHVSENMFKMARPLDPYPKLYLNDFTAVNSGASTEVSVLSGFWLVPATPTPPPPLAFTAVNSGASTEVSVLSGF